jgi:HAD superfamily hydrolase (TIGR01509 family)
LSRELPDPVAALLLDLDGTLVDTEHRHFESAIQVLAIEGVSLRPDDLLPYVGWAELAFWHDLKTRFHLRPPTEELLQRRALAYVTLVHGRRIDPLPGVVELLQWAAAQALPCAVASSSPRALIQASLLASGLDEFLTVYRSGHEDAARGKPEPDVYHAAAAALGVRAEECVALEDSPTGVRSARAAGAFTIALPCPSHPAAPQALAVADLLLGDALQALDFLRARARLAPSNAAARTSPKRST